MYTQNLLNKNFSTSGNARYVTVNIVFGVKDINKTGGDSLWNSSFVGEVIFDPDFDPKLKRVQAAMKSFCLQLRKQSFVVEDTTSCWIEEFDDWLRERYRKRIPVEEDQYYKYLNEWTSDPPIGTRTGASRRRQRRVGLVNGTMYYSEFSAQSNVTSKDPSSVKQPEYDKWEAFMEEWRKTAPKELKGVYQDTGLVWGWMPTERAFVESAESGITISMVFAFLILLVATGNLLQSILALACVFIIIASVLAIMQMQGWQLGIIESIAVVITIGLSVDYVIHLSTDYMHSPAESRNSKM